MQNLQRNNDKLKKKIEEMESNQNGLHKEALALSRMMVCPGESEVVRAPTLFPSRGCSRHFTRTFTINSSGIDTPFGMRLSPHIQDFLDLGVGSPAMPVGGISAAVRSMEGTDAAEVSVANYATGVSVAHYYQSPQALVGFANKYFGVSWVDTATGKPTFASISNGSKIKSQVEVLATRVGGFNSVLYQLGPGETRLIRDDFSLASVWTGYYFRILDGGEGITLSFNQATATSIATDSKIRPIVKDEWLDRAQVARYRVSAMSLLVSYRGNMLENAGVIAALRAPSKWVPTGNNLYNSITSVVDDQYHGPLINGAYVWWLPQDLEDLDFISTHGQSDDERTALFIGGIFGDDNASMEVTVDVVVDFYSPLQIFERMNFPPSTEVYRRLYHELSLLPAATCNPSHLDLLKKVGKKAAKGTVKGVRYLQAHPAIVENFVKALTLLL